MTKVTNTQKNVVRKRASNCCEKCGVKIRGIGTRSYNGSVHHRLPQRMGGLHKIYNLVFLCLTCHREVHQDEYAASLEGWIAWSDPDVTPVLRQGRGLGPGWALLVPDGTLEHLSHQEGERLCAFVNGHPQGG